MSKKKTKPTVVRNRVRVVRINAELQRIRREQAALLEKSNG